MPLPNVTKPEPQPRRPSSRLRAAFRRLSLTLALLPLLWACSGPAVISPTLPEPPPSLTKPLRSLPPVPTLPPSQPSASSPSGSPK